MRDGGVQVRLGYVPNFDELHTNFQEELLARKQAAQVTTPKPFKLHNERVGDVAAKVRAHSAPPPAPPSVVWGVDVREWTGQWRKWKGPWMHVNGKAVGSSRNAFESHLFQ